MLVVRGLMIWAIPSAEFLIDWVAERKRNIMLAMKEAITKQGNTDYLKIAQTITAERLVVQLALLDKAIVAYNDELERAQPLLSGRVLVKFSKIDQVKIDDDHYYDQAPYVGRMLRKATGDWIFLRVRKVDLADLPKMRIGKGSKDDARVIKILRRLSQMLIAREAVITLQKKQRVENLRITQSIGYLYERMEKELIPIREAITVDWKNNAKAEFDKFIVGKADKAKRI